MRRNVILATIIAAIAGAGGVYYLAGTPQYSLYLLRTAVRDGDRATFHRHFDVARVIQSSISRTVGGIRAGPGLVDKRAQDLALPAAERVLRKRIDERLDDPRGAPVLDMSVDSVRYQGSAAIVMLRNGSDDSTTTIVLERMRDRKWKVVDLDLAAAGVPFALSDMM